jgi:hypothetical protein
MLTLKLPLIQVYFTYYTCPKSETYTMMKTRLRTIKVKAETFYSKLLRNLTNGYQNFEKKPLPPNSVLQYLPIPLY